MSWRERKRNASFRGVPIYVPERVREGGRRGPTHEFPQRDLPDAEDTGRSLRRFSVEALVFGEDYDVDRDRLLTALEAPGAGVYVDPWQASHKVVARTYRVNENDKEGGLARFSITFEEAGDPRFPTVTLDTLGSVRSAADALSSAAGQSFADVFKVQGLPQFVADDAVTIAESWADRLTAGRVGLAQLPGAGQGLVPDAARVIADFKAAVPDAVRGDFAGAAGAALRGIAEASYMPGASLAHAGSPRGANDFFAGLAGFDPGLPAVPVTTATRAVQAANRAAQTDLFKRLAIAEEARALVAVPFRSFDGATAARDGFTARLDGLLTAAGGRFDDTAFDSLKALRSSVVRDIAARSGGLPRIRRVEVPASLPAAVLAHKLLGDARRADDLLDRNSFVTHPGFVPPGAALEILGS